MKSFLFIVISTLLVAHSLIAQQKSEAVQHFAFKDLPAKPINELLTRSMISGQDGTLGYFVYKKGAVVPTHHHQNEQYSLITQGSVKVLIGEQEYIVKAGEGMIIPPSVPHSFIALEDNTIDIDFFAPRRQDWIDGTDNYYKPAPAEAKRKVGAWNKKPVAAEAYAIVDKSVGNIAFTPKGELVYSHHPFFSPDHRVVKYDAATKTVSPFPNKAWNTPRETDDQYLSSVLGIRNDANGIIWMLDMGQRNSIMSKIVGWNTLTNQLERVYYIPAPASIPTSQHNDFVVDLKHQVFIIADEGIGNGGGGSQAALVTVDMKTGKARRLLQGHYSTYPENRPVVFKKKVLAVEGKPLMVGADGITADFENEWLYYAPLNGSKVYRLKVDDLLDESLSASALGGKVETYAPKPNNGGLSIDKDNSLYLTALETNSVAVILAKDRSMHTFTSDKNMLWPDGISYNPADGYFYVSAAQVHLGAAFQNGKSKATTPFYIFRFKPLAEGLMGR